MTAAPLSTPVLAAINHLLGEADWARQMLQPFAGRKVHVAMPPLSFDLTIGEDGHLRAGAMNAPADLDILLPGATPLLALQGVEPVLKAARISGPADLAEALNFVATHLRWDIEEDLSKIVGDIAAHRIVGTLDALGRWQRDASRNLFENIGEYLVEENPMLAKPADIGVLADDIRRLLDNLAALEARITHLQEKNP